MSKSYWRSNIIATYFDTNRIGENRDCILELINSLAFFLALDCVVTVDCFLAKDGVNPVNPLESGAVCDMIYVKSTKRTKMSYKAFESLILKISDSISDEISEGMMLCPQEREYLLDYPYPNIKK